MTNGRSLLWLTAVLALTATAHVLLRYKGETRQSFVPRLHLLEPAAERATRLAVSRKGAPETVLSRARRWRMVAPYTAVADEKAVLRLLDALTTADIEATTGDQELLRLGRTREDFGLADPRVRLTVTDPDGETEVSFGSATPAGDGCYAAVSGVSAVYVVSTNVVAAVDLPPEGFRRRAVFPTGADAALAFDVKRGTGSFMRFAREGELWLMVQPRRATASAARVKALLEGVMSASAVDFVWPTGAAEEPSAATAALLAGYGLDPESAVTVTVKCADGVDRQISFGKEAGAGHVYALVQNAGAVVTVPAALKDAAVADVADFTDTRLFPLDESAVSRLSVTDDGIRYLLARGEDGAWLMEAPVSAPTDPDGVSAFLGRICSLRLEDLATNGVTIAVTPGDKPVSVARAAALDGFRLAGLRSREIVRVDASAVRRLVVTDARASVPTAVVFDRDRRVWNVESSGRAGVASEAAVSGLLGALDPLRAEWIVKLKVTASDLRACGLDEPWLTVAIDYNKEDAVRRNVLVGGEAPGGGRYATLGATDAVFVLSDETVRRLSAPLVKER